MATQHYCDKALRTLVSRIKRDARAAGIQSIREMERATRMPHPTLRGSFVSRSGIDKIWHCRSYPTFDTLLAMARACGVTVNQWLDDDMQQLEPESEQPEQQPEQQAEQGEQGEQGEPEQAEQAEASEPSEPTPGDGAAVSAEEKDTTPPVDKSGTAVDLLAVLKGMRPMS